MAPSFQEVNRLLALSFKDNAPRKEHRRYFFPNVEIKDFNVMIKEKNDKLVKTGIKTYDNNLKTTTRR